MSDALYRRASIMIRSLRFITALTVVALSATFANAQQMQLGPPPPMAVPPGMTYGNNVVNYRVNRFQSFLNDQQPVEAFLTQFSRRSWLRLEFMLWDIEDPGDRTIGAPIDGADGNAPVEVFDTGTGDTFGFAIVPEFNGVTLNHNAGIRGTYGIFFDGGELEFSVMGNDQASGVINFSNLQQNRPELPDPNVPNPPAPDASLGTVNNPNVIIPVLVDGVAGTADNLGFIGFDSSYRSSLQSQFWGSELNVLSAPQASVNALTWQWLGGLRYLNFDESFNQTGVSDGGGAFAPVTTRIRSSTTNNMYGPTIGFRTQLASKYFTFNATPRITFALNDATSRQSFSQGLTSNSLTEEDVDFTTLTQVSMSAQFHPNEAWTFFAGYDFFWSNRAVRPFRGTSYDGTLVGGDLQPQIGLSPNPESLYLQGLSFGFTFRF